MIDQDSGFMNAILEEKLKEMHNFNDIAQEHMAYCEVDGNLNVQNVSKAFSDIMGYTDDSLRNQNFSKIIDKDSVSKFYNGCEYVKNQGKESWGTELTLISKFDQDIYTKTIICPIFYEDKHSGFILVIHDITSAKLLHKLQVKMFSQEKLDNSSLDFVSTTSAAVIDTISYKVSMVVKVVVGFIFLFLIYAVSFDIDELARGTGKFIPTSKIQSLKNYEGGILSSIEVSEGDSVVEGQILLRLNTLAHQTKLDENKIRLTELLAKVVRLEAESTGVDIDKIVCHENCDERLLDLEKSYYFSNISALNKNISKQQEQIKSKQSEMIAAKNRYSVLSKNYSMLEKEFQVKKVLEKKKIFTKYELGLLERELNDAKSELNSSKELVVQLKNQIQEIRDAIEETKLNFRNKASLQYGETLAEILRLQETKKNLEDIIRRTVIKSPVNGIVKELFFHTLGTSIQSSAELLTIVPDNYEMVAEVKIKPEEIAKLHIGQKVKLKVTAFDYSIYGDLEGKITNISPDTITDKDTGENQYLIYVKTDKNYLNNNEKYKIKIGMMVNADVLVGKKSIMSFLLKPILKTTQRD
ncbi:MAG: HlyD family type I secretion periplasmic adaptor subunit [Campylobacterota bacterium]|nr:HlyD family type I secretion periplasmic adaptor subunit [Campylobacterota bacterium]